MIKKDYFDKIVIEERVEKRLPFTATPINDIAQWRAKRKLEFEKLEAQRMKRADNVKQALFDNSIELTQSFKDVLEGKTVSDAYKMWNSKDFSKRHEEPNVPHVLDEVKISWFQQLKYKLADFFIRLNFG
jgi:hypothetical protein